MIYVAVNFGSTTGGPETLHQVVNAFNKLGYDSKIYYERGHTLEITERYKYLNIEAADRINDLPENILIVPETLTYIIKRYKKIKICIWWLSLDFYKQSSNIGSTLRSMDKYSIPKILFPAAFVFKLLKGSLHWYRYRFEDNNSYFHAYNCEYAYRYILANGVSKERSVYLCGPINDIYFESSKHVKSEIKTNIILYNPKKGYKFTRKIIEYAKKSELEARFIPIQNMTPVDISRLMSVAKIYIDFGEFPGPERIPREAVTMKCNIITSCNGAAANDEDVPIPRQFKFDQIDDNIPVIIKKLKFMLSNYDSDLSYFDGYRLKVFNQKAIFQQNAKKLIEIINSECRA